MYMNLWKPTACINSWAIAPASASHIASRFPRNMYIYIYMHIYIYTYIYICHLICTGPESMSCRPQVVARCKSIIVLVVNVS